MALFKGFGMDLQKNILIVEKTNSSCNICYSIVLVASAKAKTKSGKLLLT